MRFAIWLLPLLLPLFLSGSLAILQRSFSVDLAVLEVRVTAWLGSGNIVFSQQPFYGQFHLREFGIEEIPEEFSPSSSLRAVFGDPAPSTSATKTVIGRYRSVSIPIRIIQAHTLIVFLVVFYSTKTRYRVSHAS